LVVVSVNCIVVVFVVVLVFVVVVVDVVPIILILPQIYCALTQELVGVATGHEGEISKLAFNPQGTRLLTASSDKTARIWDVTNAQCVQVGGQARSRGVWQGAAMDSLKYR
jgi:WD40 repeat protein